MKRCILALILSLASLPGAALGKPSSSADSLNTLSRLAFGGQDVKALDFFDSMKLKKAKDAWEKRLQFLAALLYLRAGQAEKATEQLRLLQNEYAPMNDYVDFYLALALRDKQPKESISILQKMKSRKIPGPLKERLDRETALSFCKAGDRGNGIDLLNQLAQTDASAARTYNLRYDRAKCLMDMGDKREAAVNFKNLYLSNPEGDLGPEILKNLASLGEAGSLSAEEHVQRADLLMERNRPDLAVIDLEQAGQAYGGSAPPSFKEKLAAAYFKARKYRQAASAMEELRGRDPAFDSKELEKLGQAYSRSDQFDAALGVYRDLRQSPGASAEQIDFKIAFLTMDKGDYLQANQLLRDLLERYPNHPKKNQALWYLAWNHYLLGEYPEALQALDVYEAQAPKSDEHGRLSYWRARILEKQKKTGEAHALYQSVASSESYSYYGFLSLKRLEGAWSPTELPRKQWAGGLPRLGLPGSFSMRELEQSGKEEVQRLKELLLVGLWEDFLVELNQAAAGEGLRRALSGGSGGAVAAGDEAGRWQDRYPPAYSTLVSFFSQIRQLPMPLTWGIMREESRFRPDVVSPANAIGLMQIIAPTGAEIARDLGRQNFSPESLYQPAVNIEFGVHYLTKNLLRFDNNLIETIASYNAGPEAVERWAKARPNRDWDEFVEEIPYAETQNYVRKVLKSFYLYQLLYGS